MPASGGRRFRSMSYVSAFSGETYRTRTVPSCSRVAGGRGWRDRRSRHHRNAARVLPLPVGAWMSVWWPAEMAAHPSACAFVGASKVASNQALTGALKGASGSLVVGRIEVATGTAEYTAGRDFRPDVLFCPVTRHGGCRLCDIEVDGRATDCGKPDRHLCGRPCAHVHSIRG